MSRPKVGSVLVQCAGDVRSLPWQEVRRVVVTEAHRRSDTVLGQVYRQSRDTGQWDEFIGEIPVPKDTLQGGWDEYVEWRSL